MIGGFFMHSVLLVMIALSLSMDAFSLSLAYGTLNLEKKYIYLLTIIVGSFHFVMPLIGNWIGTLILSFVPMNPDLIVFIVLTFIGIEMILDSRKEETDMKKMSYFELLLFGFAVSIDSFSVGLGLMSFTHHLFLTAFLFSFCSAFFTYIGLLLGKKVNQKIGRISTLIGGILIVFIGILYIL